MLIGSGSGSGSAYLRLPLPLPLIYCDTVIVRVTALPYRE